MKPLKFPSQLQLKGRSRRGALLVWVIAFILIMAAWAILALIDQAAYEGLPPYGTLVAMVCASLGIGVSPYVLAAIPLVLAAALCSYALPWLWVRGAPSWLLVLIAGTLMLDILYVQVAMKPTIAGLACAVLLVLALKLHDAALNHGNGIRSPRLFCTVLTLLAVLILLDLAFTLVALAALLMLLLACKDSRRRILIGSLCMLVLTLAVVLLLFPVLGWRGGGAPVGASGTSVTGAIDPFQGLLTFSLAAPGSGFSLPLVLLLLVFLILLLARPMRAFVVFVPLLLVMFLIWFLPERPGFADLGTAFLLATPLLLVMPFVMDNGEEKEKLRTRILATRRSIESVERSEATDRIIEKLCTEIEAVSPGNGYIGIYAARGSEVNLTMLVIQLGAKGYRFAYPVVLSDHEMVFSAATAPEGRGAVQHWDDTQPLGAQEGQDLHGLTRVKPQDLSVIVVPAIAYDTRGYRLGFGKGFYDRYLRSVPRSTLLLGAGFKEQLVATLPVEEHDLPLDAIVTP